jgi:hypothetical protein
MNIDDIKHRIESRLYGEELARGVLEFAWGNTKDPSLFNDRLKAAKEDCQKIGVKWIDADPMTAQIVAITPKEHAKPVVDIMRKYGFELVSQVFDPKPTDSLGGSDTP